MDIYEFKDLCIKYDCKGLPVAWSIFNPLKNILSKNCTSWTKTADKNYKSTFKTCSNIITFKNPEKQLYYDWDGGLAYLIINSDFKCGFYFDYKKEEFNPPYILDFDDKFGNRFKQSFKDISALCATANELTQNKYSDLFSELSSTASSIKLEEWLEIYHDLHRTRNDVGERTYLYNNQPILSFSSGEYNWLI